MPDIEAIADTTPKVIDATVEVVPPPTENGLFLCLIDINGVTYFAGLERTLSLAIAALNHFKTSKNRRILRIVEPRG